MNDENQTRRALYTPALFLHIAQTQELDCCPLYAPFLFVMGEHPGAFSVPQSMCRKGSEQSICMCVEPLSKINFTLSHDNLRLCTTNAVISRTFQDVCHRFRSILQSYTGNTDRGPTPTLSLSTHTLSACPPRLLCLRRQKNIQCHCLIPRLYPPRVCTQTAARQAHADTHAQFRVVRTCIHVNILIQMCHLCTCMHVAYTHATFT